MRAVIVLVPAYEPARPLVDLVASLRAADPRLHVVVVDDGSGPDFAHVFAAAQAAGALVLTHPTNRGKGAALKTGFAYVGSAFPGHDVVCADCDGQHSVVDVLRVADRVQTTADVSPSDEACAAATGRSPATSTGTGTGTDPSTDLAMVLGSRRFVGDVPLRSRVGNSLTRTMFRLSTGLDVHDTQTGLRGYPAAMLPWLLTIDGDRYEYELNLLLRASTTGRAVEEIEIATIYLDDNASSHFRPVVDSARIYAPLLRFTLASFAAFLVDTVALLVLHALTGSLLGAVLGARAVSSTVNFVTNRRLVFEAGREKPVASAAVQYYAVVALLLAANYALLLALTSAGLALLPAKVLTEVVLFVASYELQRRVVFARPPLGRSTAPAPASARRGRRTPAT